MIIKDLVIETIKVKSRSVVFRSRLPDWDLNIHLIKGDKYNYLVDTGLGSSYVEPVKEYLKDSPLPLIVINTHHDWDHIWGNVAFSDNVIAAHKLCRKLVVENWEKTVEENKDYISGNNTMTLPNLLFDTQIYFPEDKIRIFYTPGHTVDSISVFDELDNVLNVGDNIGDNELDIIPSIEGKKRDYLETLYKYNELDFDTCISGHNSILGKSIIQDILDKIKP